MAQVTKKKTNRTSESHRIRSLIDAAENPGRQGAGEEGGEAEEEEVPPIQVVVTATDYDKDVTSVVQADDHPEPESPIDEDSPSDDVEEE